jgi:hypothetical protein
MCILIYGYYYDAIALPNGRAGVFGFPVGAGCGLQLQIMNYYRQITEQCAYMLDINKNNNND